MDFRTLPWLGLYARGPVKCQCPLTYVEEAKALSFVLGGIDLEPDAIVANGEIKLSLAAEEFRLYARGLGGTGDIREAFLDDSVDGRGNRFGR